MKRIETSLLLPARVAYTTSQQSTLLMTIRTKMCACAHGDDMIGGMEIDQPLDGRETDGRI